MRIIDFPQYNLSIQDPITQTSSHDDSDRQDLVHDHKADQTLTELWIAAETDKSEFQVISEVLQRLAVVDTCRHFIPYLMGWKFTIVTDNRALNFLANKDPTSG